MRPVYRVRAGDDSPSAPKRISHNRRRYVKPLEAKPKPKTEHAAPASAALGHLLALRARFGRKRVPVTYSHSSVGIRSTQASPLVRTPASAKVAMPHLRRERRKGPQTRIDLMTTSIDLLRQLAEAYGVYTSYHDDQGRVQEATPEALLAVLRILGAPLQQIDE